MAMIIFILKFLFLRLVSGETGTERGTGGFADVCLSPESEVASVFSEAFGCPVAMAFFEASVLLLLLLDYVLTVLSFVSDEIFSSGLPSASSEAGVSVSLDTDMSEDGSIVAASC